MRLEPTSSLSSNQSLATERRRPPDDLIATTEATPGGPSQTAPLSGRTYASAGSSAICNVGRRTQVAIWTRGSPYRAPRCGGGSATSVPTWQRSILRRSNRPACRSPPAGRCYRSTPSMISTAGREPLPLVAVDRGSILGHARGPVALLRDTSTTKSRFSASITRRDGRAYADPANRHAMRAPTNADATDGGDQPPSPPSFDYLT